MLENEKELRAEMMIRCAEHYHQLGIVGAHDPFVDSLTLRTYQEVVDARRFPFRLYAYISNYWADPLISADINRGFGSEWLKIGAIKIFLDGGMELAGPPLFLRPMWEGAVEREYSITIRMGSTGKSRNLIGLDTRYLFIPKEIEPSICS